MSFVASDAEHPDAALIALGKELDVEWNKEKAAFAALPANCSDEEAFALLEPCTQICDKIELIRARTLDGLRIKARAINWGHGGEYYDLDDGENPDQRMSISIIRDLLAL